MVCDLSGDWLFGVLLLRFVVLMFVVWVGCCLGLLLVVATYCCSLNCVVCLFSLFVGYVGYLFVGFVLLWFTSVADCCFCLFRLGWIWLGLH